MDFEYAIKMDVRNNPIVREVDEARQRELWRSLLIGSVLVAVVLFSLWQRFSVMRIGAEIERMQRELHEEREVNGQLRLEVETLSSPRRVERLASARPLSMELPDRKRTLVLERATTSTPPAGVVVRRGERDPSGPGVDPLGRAAQEVRR
jgi:cell division protein FtsL